MQVQRHGRGLVAGATISNKMINQDAFALVRNEKVPFSAVINADGLGSHFGAECASSIVAETMGQLLEEVGSAHDFDMSRLFCEAKRSIEQYVEGLTDSLPPDLDRTNAFGTTALCAVEMADEIILGYVGNGAIFHIRGNFNTFPKSQLLPWTALNYLNPHTLPQNGKNVMYKLLSAKSSYVEMTPTILTLRKDRELLGDIILCCTDGVYSYDQTPMGRDSEQQIWISGERTMSLFFESLDSFFNGDPTEEALGASLEAFLSKLQASNLVSDDCTIGVLITNTVLEYQETLKSLRVKDVAS